MNDEKKNIEDALDKVKSSMEQDDTKESGSGKSKSKEEGYFLLNKIISRKKSLIKSENTISQKELENKVSSTSVSNAKNKNSNTNKKLKANESPKNINKKDPISSLVDKEIKPIIKKWINKNLRSFVKTIVVEEMKLITKVTQKPK